MSSETIEILIPEHPEEWAAAADILHEYAHTVDSESAKKASLEEASALPGPFAQPSGLFLIAASGPAVLGCGTYRSRSDLQMPNACEMGRLYVRPQARRLGLGRTIATELLDRAKASGYTTMLLNVLSDSEAARELYHSMGFESVTPYEFDVIKGGHTYLMVDLESMITRY